MRIRLMFRPNSIELCMRSLGVCAEDTTAHSIRVLEQPFVAPGNKEYKKKWAYKVSVALAKIKSGILVMSR